MSSLDRLYDTLAASAADLKNAHAPLATRAEHLSAPAAPVTPEHSSEDVRELFMQQESLQTLAVVEGGRPIGLINRNAFMEQYARPFSRELYGRKSCTTFMDTDPVVVETSTPIELLVKAAVGAGNRVLREGFITTTRGQYAGMGTGFGLMKAMSDIEAEKTRQLLASISYASLIQRSHLAESDRVLQQHLPDHGLLWEPRDVVGGDAYFFRPTQGGLLGCVFDCTGHGVPGAFMTLIVLSFLEQAVDPARDAPDPGALLTAMHRYIQRVLQQRPRTDDEKAGHPEKESSDGLDAAMFVLASDGRSLRFASARLSLLVRSAGDEAVTQVDGDRAGIGYAETPDDHTWATHQVPLGIHAMVLIPTDGVIDQIGGPKQIAHGRRRLMQFMADQQGTTAHKLCARFHASFGDWQGTQRRRDDVTLLAFSNRSTQGIAP
ncbi:MAG: serine/threonine protein phosphatase [Burkholderiaceae bacterium]|nr:MAG: serine/threonine protein phosphatase [Burkholderiaceae bacterium]